MPCNDSQRVVLSPSTAELAPPEAPKLLAVAVASTKTGGPGTCATSCMRVATPDNISTEINAHTRTTEPELICANRPLPIKATVKASIKASAVSPAKPFNGTLTLTTSGCPGSDAPLLGSEPKASSKASLTPSLSLSKPPGSAAGSVEPTKPCAKSALATTASGTAMSISTAKPLTSPEIVRSSSPTAPNETPLGISILTAIKSLLFAKILLGSTSTLSELIMAGELWLRLTALKLLLFELLSKI